MQEAEDAGRDEDRAHPEPIVVECAARARVERVGQVGEQSGASGYRQPDVEPALGVALERQALARVSCQARRNGKR